MITKLKIGVYYRSTNPQKELEDKIKEILIKKGLIFDNVSPDILFYIGGDGTFLRAVNHYIDQIDYIKFLGLKAGTLGFFYDFNKDEYEQVIDLIINNELVENRHYLLDGDIILDNNEHKHVLALNEIRIESPFKTLICDVAINNQPLEKFRGNGLSVCTSLGSSGYNKSLNGALVDHKLNIMELSEIAPINNHVYRSIGSPLILSKDNTISFKGDFSTMRLGFDYQNFDLSGVKELAVSISNKQITLLNKKDMNCLRRFKRSFIEE